MDKLTTGTFHILQPALGRACCNDLGVFVLCLSTSFPAHCFH